VGAAPHIQQAVAADQGSSGETGTHMKLVFSKAVGRIKLLGLEMSDKNVQHVVLEVDGAEVSLPIGSQFVLVADLVVGAPKSVMPYVKDAYIEAGYTYRTVD
jgi:hypothetical protein